jgi:hypothetical protein
MPNLIYDERIVHHSSLRASEPFPIDGNLDKPVWKKAPRSRRFVDMVSGEPAFFDTRMASLWDDRCLYAA